MTDTETDKRPKIAGRTVLSRIVGFIITLVFVVILAVNLQLILKGDTEFAPIAYTIVAGLYLIADSVRAGINMAVAGLPMHVSQASDDD